MRRLALVHTGVNALLLALGYYWLGIGESRALTLLWGLLVALAAVALACEQYGAAFAYFRAPGNPWRTALRNLLPLATASLAILLVYLLLARWAEYSPTPATRFASYLTLTFRKPVRPSTILRIFTTALWIVRWIVVPVLLLPMLSAIAGTGWRGFAAIGSMTRRWRYWIETPLLLLCGLWLPLRLLGWVPHLDAFGWQMISLLLRAVIAYLLFIAAGLALAWASAHRPVRATSH